VNAPAGRRRFLLAGVGALAAGAMPRAFAGGAATVLRATDVHVDGYPTVAAVRWIGEQLARETDGRLGLRMYFAGQLGSEAVTTQLARFGAVDLTRLYLAAVNNLVPETQVLSLPYLIESSAHLRRVLDGAVGKRILAGFARRDLVGLAFYDCGARNFYNTRRPLHGPGDLHGLKLRVPPSDLFMDLVRALGANPTPLSYGEVFTALSTHLIDGAENNVKSFHSSRHFEVARYWSESAHAYTPDVLLMSRLAYDALSPADRERMHRLAAESVPVMRAAWAGTEAEARARILADGVQSTPVDRPAFARATEGLLLAARRRPGLAALYESIRALA
jgi:tripartite ATP-independent transporter DctP family solute receptor